MMGLSTTTSMRTPKQKLNKSLLDKFCVRDAFYHEFSMAIDGIPRSYLVKQCRDCHIEKLQGKYTEAKVSNTLKIILMTMPHLTLEFMKLIT